MDNKEQLVKAFGDSGFIRRSAAIGTLEVYRNTVEIKVRERGCVPPSMFRDVVNDCIALLTDYVFDADVRENVRGHWTNVQIYVTGSSMADCSICGVTVHNSFMGNAAPNFCPNCGADMRERKKKKQ